MDVFFNDTLVEPDIPFRWDGNTAWFAATLTRRYTHPQSWGDATSIGAAPVDEADDPGNPGHVLRLFDTPDQIYNEPTRLLVMSNASLDRDGTRRAYAETVPAEIGSAVAAAAWQFGVDADMYRQLERAT
jgi:hypothetical protein